MRLEIWLNEGLVGWLSHEGERNQFGFEYAPTWLEAETHFPLSPRLPLPQIPEGPAAMTTEARSALVRAFFENLLPEGDALDDVAGLARTSKANLVGLLIAVGRESAGAFRIRPERSESKQEPRRLRHLPREELSARIRERPQLPFSVWDGKVRLSIAGFQEKIGAFQLGDQWYLADGDAMASTHILKPEPRRELLAGLTSNEFFCMRLASVVKVTAAAVELLHVPEPVLAIQRFDRRAHGGPPEWLEAGAPELSPAGDLGVERIHVIDGCQALGMSPSHKYERPYGENRDVATMRIGASYPRLFDLLRYSPTPARDRLRLLRWAVFQVLIGNTDAHAKNLSFYFGPPGMTLAPAYDLLSGMALRGEGIDQTYAMAIGDAFTSAELNADQWIDFTIRSGLNLRQVRAEMIRMIGATLTALPEVAQMARNASADMAVVARVVDVIRAECHRQLAIAPGIERPRVA